MRVIQDRNRQEIRVSIGYNIGDVIVGEATSTVDSSSLLDTYTFARHQGDDDLNGRQVIIYDATGSIVDGEKSFVSDYAAATWDATCAPVFTASIADGDKFEMWKVFTVEEVHDIINQIIMDVSRRCLQPEQTINTVTDSDAYEYDCLSGFEGIYMVEYVADTGTEVDVDDCDTVWTAGASVTASLDEDLQKEGDGCVKLVVAAGAASGATLAYGAFTAVDITACDRLEFWFYSSIALTAGQLQIMLDDTAACASALETIDIPATAAGKWIRHSVSLANPLSDSAIISAGIRQASGVDVGACTLYIDDIKGVASGTREYKELNPQYWSLVRGTTNYLKLTSAGLATAGDDTLLRLSGYKLPALLTNDTTDSEIDPEYIIKAATAYLLLNHAKSSALDIENRQSLGDRYMGMVEKMKSSISTEIRDDTRFI